MKKNMFHKLSLLFIFALVFPLVLGGCGRPDNEREEDGREEESSASAEGNRNGGSSDEEGDDSVDETDGSESPAAAVSELEVCFGDEGEPFVLHLYENDTAAAIARYVGTADWRLPIYHYDDYDNWEVMQYYDIPSSYDIPSAPEAVSSEKAGEVYYSAPNRIVLFYGDAQVDGEYTKVGYFDDTEEFRKAVEENPVLEGWGNKIVLIQSTQEQ